MSPDERSIGPPVDDEGRAQVPAAALITTPDNAAPDRPRRRVHSSAQRSRRGRYGCAWREGFGYGFRDALRLAARELPPETWHTLDRLADEYELAGDD